MRRTHRAAAAALAAIASVGLVTACSTGDDAVAQNQSNQFVSPGGKLDIDYPVGERKAAGRVSAPDLLTGETIDLDQFAGDVVVINVWASWCAPCRKEFTELEATYQATKDKGVAFLGLDFRDSKSNAQDFFADNKVSYRSMFDYGGATIAALGVPVGAVPTTIILDRQHRPAKVFLKAITEQSLTEAVLDVAAEEPAPTAKRPE
ncbi:TlpA family protein disulfide reductase [Gordonia humi]|uniref:Thiol-disulfide isomerase/thioredoxin n=1 Tax=Gordonia humi TaxID=686429 RepID=A0A840EWA6_9ACTN|nr:TlpA disulfide reductase family protein [Gordonia humi]MBB4134594.1 thiol-disulfide isomerase/thioredoxin [Gordonia humi]